MASHPGRLASMTNTAAAADREPLAGLVERVTYHNPDNGYCVLRVKVGLWGASDTVGEIDN